jgi:hypothetical protein
MLALRESFPRTNRFESVRETKMTVETLPKVYHYLEDFNMELSKHFSIMTICIALLMLGSTNLFSRARLLVQEPTTKKEEQVVLAIVQRYMSLSSEGKFDDLTEITILKPDRYRENSVVDAKELAKQYPPGTAVVTSMNRAEGKEDLRQLRKVFPQVIRDGGHRIMIVAGTSVKGELAKVSVHLGNERQYQALPMVFVLNKEGPNGKWKIFDVTTPAYAEKYQ